MGVEVYSGTIIFRRWEQETGLAETEQSFNTLEELFEVCMHRTEDQPQVDRIVIDGVDVEGHHHRLLMDFRSMSDHL